MKLIYLPLCAFFSFSIFGQTDCERVLIKGQVIDTLRPKSFYNLMVINKSSGRGVFGLPDGKYSVYAANNDTITLSVQGYKLRNFVVQANENCQDIRKIYIEQKPQEIDEVIVRPLKSLEQIQEERSELALRETRTVTGVDVMQSPITALYETFSKRAKSKKWVAKMEYADKQKAILQELLHLYVAFEILDLSESEFDAFIAFLNIDDNFLRTASEMELVTFIKDKFHHFKLLLED